jgi:hypothetical protein
MKKTMTDLSAIALAGFVGLQSGWAIAQSNPDYQIEVQQNTICSFINSNNVNIRQAPNLRSRVIRKLNRGDGVRAQFDRWRK